MFNKSVKIEDPFDDEIGKALRGIKSLTKWTREKHEERAKLITLLENSNYISFRGHVDKYHLSCVGESCFYDVPANRRGHLRVFSGMRVRLVCVWSGRYDRLYMAGKVKGA
jgi:hypothetical protein